jgi:hypothetical protein
MVEEKLPDKLPARNTAVYAKLAAKQHLAMLICTPA